MSTPRVHLKMPAGVLHACGRIGGRSTWVVAGCTCRLCLAMLERHPDLVARIRAARQVTVDELLARRGAAAW